MYTTVVYLVNACYDLDNKGKGDVLEAVGKMSISQHQALHSAGMHQYFPQSISQQLETMICVFVLRKNKHGEIVQTSTGKTALTGNDYVAGVSIQCNYF